MIAQGRIDPERDPRLAEMAQELDLIAEEECAVVRAALDVEHAPGLDQVEPVLDRIWKEEQEGVDRRRRFRVLSAIAGVAAAAALALLFTTGSPDGSETPGPSIPDPVPGAGGPSEIYLGAEEFEILHPRGDVTDWNVLEWSGPEGARYVLRVRDAADGSLVYGPQHTMERRQTLSADITDKWPAEIVIELEMRRGDGTPEFTDTAARKIAR